MNRHSMKYLGIERAYDIENGRELFRIVVCIDDARTGVAQQIHVTLEEGASLTVLAGALRGLADKIEKLGND